MGTPGRAVLAPSASNEVDGMEKEAEMKDALCRIDQLEADIADLRNQYEGLWKRLDDLTAPEVRSNGKAKAESLEEVRLFCAKSGLSDRDAEWFWNKMEAIGWKSDGVLLKDWRRCVIAWKIRGYGFPSLQSVNHKSHYETHRLL